MLLDEILVYELGRLDRWQMLGGLLVVEGLLREVLVRSGGEVRDVLVVARDRVLLGEADGVLRVLAQDWRLLSGVSLGEVRNFLLDWERGGARVIELRVLHLEDIGVSDHLRSVQTTLFLLVGCSGVQELLFLDVFAERLEVLEIRVVVFRLVPVIEIGIDLVSVFEVVIEEFFGGDGWLKK